MTPGTPGFIGERLKEAREARSQTIIALADLLGVSPQAISQYEKTTSPRPEIMKKISEVLNMPETFFRHPIVKSESGVFIPRSMSSITKSARVRAERRHAWTREIARYLQRYFEFPPVNFPVFDIPSDPVCISMNQIEELASQTRRFWNLDEEPINNMVSLLENNGAIVYRDALRADTLDAYSEFSLEGRPYVCLGSDKNVCVRSRFDAGHELGHLILHSKIDKTLVTKQTEYRLLEQQAHRFAGAFLFPAQSFASEFYSTSLDALKILKPKWKVAISMMIMRALDLELISEESAKKLWIAYARRRWRNQEPLDDELEIEYPTLLRRSMEMLINNRMVTKEGVLFQLPYNPHDIEALTGAIGCLTKKSPEEEPPLKILNFPGRRSNSTSISEKNTSNNILKFPERKPRE